MKIRNRLYDIWCGMKQRCENKNCRLYPRWGGRGIKILWACYRDFKRDMGPTYQPELQIERIDNNGHYCKENCKWATPVEQANNRRSNVILEFNGQRMSVTLWEKKLGFKKYTIQSRIKHGWTVKRALTTPKIGPMFLTFRGQTLPLRTFAAKFGKDYRRVWQRIKSGWSVETALTCGPYGRKGAVL